MSLVKSIGKQKVNVDFNKDFINLFTDKIKAKDIGFIEPGQKVKISLTAYDASKYGYLSGELLQIAPDTIFREESNSSQYSVIVSIQSKILDNENSEAEISPGMIAQVDIIRCRRSILEYFWQPVAKIKETAFKE